MKNIKNHDPNRTHFRQLLSNIQHQHSNNSINRFGINFYEMKKKFITVPPGEYQGTLSVSFLHKLTAPEKSKQMPGDVFEALLQNAKLEHGSDTDYYFKSKHGNYEILFGFDGETMSVDTFGFKHNSGDWIELEPTNSQYSEMKHKPDNVEREIEHEPLPYVDEYYQNGVSREDFY